ncbi:hypothetical protein Psta_4251 [Pirellula staleyi DSM 6068]|uniref:Uncharacterized protein n=1 Tax=Pirellula staleyi (strain ATCC 27377 / DSM 6068 / ICPB 4128) TaxID=530564 RepID=D2R450_PIRSD|nr:hypothetical protein [Pirellula staleyi]ADB18899.1 hypothetical protein Psta_4251 [Pirellula staleyi DSM 6068]
MPMFSFTEKEWDKIRPSSVKKTGIGDAIKGVLKGLPNDIKSLDTDKECEKAIALLNELDKALDNAAGQLKKNAKDDKHGAAGKVKDWQKEVTEAAQMVALQKNKLAYKLAEEAVEEKMNTILEQVEDSIVQASRLTTTLTKDIRDGKTIDVPKLAIDLQNFRNALRDGNKATTRSSFIGLIKFLDPFHKDGLDVKKIEMPKVCKQIETKNTALEQLCDLMGEALADAVEAQSNVQGDGPLERETKNLVDLYKQTNQTIKGYATRAKQLLSQTTRGVTAVKGSQETDTSKLITVLGKLHDALDSYEDEMLAESYRSRNAAGDIQKFYTDLTKKPGFGPELNGVVRDWRSTVFDTVRRCTAPIAEAKKVLDEGVEYLASMGGTTASQVDTLAKKIDTDRRAIAGKYGAAVS